jgi:drug/metabolite transporter (DMT)-like permease
LRRYLLSPYLILIGPPLFWAVNAVISRAFISDALPPLALSFWRWTLAFLLLLPFTARDLVRHAGAIRRDWRYLTALALLSITTYNSFFYLALETTPAINAVLVAASLPIIIILVAWAWGAGRPRGLELAGVALSFVGLLLVVGRGDIQIFLSLSLHLGDLYVLIATLTWAIYSVWLRHRPVNLPPLAFLAVLCGIGSPFILPFYVWEMASGRFLDPTPTHLGVILFTAIFPAILAVVAWNRGVAQVGPAVAGQFSYLTPVFATGLAITFLGEEMRWFHVAGMALIFSGIAMATTLARRPQPSDSAGRSGRT